MNSRPRARVFAVASGAGLMATLVLLVLAPASMATGLAPAMVMGAPYHGVTTGTSQSWGVAGCGHAGIGVAPFFHANTGIGGFWAKAWAPTCNNPLGSGGSSMAAFSSLVPIRVHHSNSTIVALVNVTVTGHAKVVAGVCAPSSSQYSYCSQAAYASLTGFAWVHDKTTGMFYYSSTYWPGVYSYASDTVSCFAGNCSTYAVAGGPIWSSSTFAWSFNVAGVHSSDHLELGITFSGWASASESVYSTTMAGGSASAGLNTATGVNGVDLASITIT